MSQELTKFEKWIVHRTEQAYVYGYENNTKICFIGGFTALMFSLTNLLKNTNMMTKIVFNICIIISITPMILSLLFGKFNFINLTFRFFTKINNLPFGDRKRRIEEVASFIDAQIELERERIRSQKPETTEDLSNLSNMVKSFNENPQEFIRNNFNKNQSFIRFYLEKAFLDGSPQFKFIRNSLLVPKRKTINPESLKKILISLYSGAPYIQDSNFPKESFIEQIFEKYTEQQIETLFCKRFETKEFEIFWEQIHKDKVLNLPICDSFREFGLESKKIIPREILEMDLNVADLNPKLLKTKRDYDEASSIFSNCVKTYFDRQSYVVTYSGKDNRPVACVNFNNDKKILEMSGFRNASLDRSLKKKILDVFQKKS